MTDSMLYGALLTFVTFVTPLLGGACKPKPIVRADAALAEPARDGGPAGAMQIACGDAVCRAGQEVCCDRLGSARCAAASPVTRPANPGDSIAPAGLFDRCAHTDARSTHAQCAPLLRGDARLLQDARRRRVRRAGDRVPATADASLRMRRARRLRPRPLVLLRRREQGPSGARLVLRALVRIGGLARL